MLDSRSGSPTRGSSDLIFSGRPVLRLAAVGTPHRISRERGKSASLAENHLIIMGESWDNRGDLMGFYGG